MESEGFQSTLCANHPELKVQSGEIRPISFDDAETLVPDSKTAMLNIFGSVINFFPPDPTKHMKGGQLVTSGTVSVNVKQGRNNQGQPNNYNPSKDTTVTARTGFSAVAAQPTEDTTVTEQSPTFSCTPDPDITFRVPPLGGTSTPNDRLFGYSCLNYEPVISENEITIELRKRSG